MNEDDFVMCFNQRNFLAGQNKGQSTSTAKYINCKYTDEEHRFKTSSIVEQLSQLFPLASASAQTNEDDIKNEGEIKTTGFGSKQLRTTVLQTKKYQLRSQ